MPDPKPVRRKTGRHARRDAGRQAEAASLLGALKKSQADLESLRAERWTFWRAITHDVRTPLQGIMGQAMLLGDPDLPADRRRRHLATLLQETDRLANVVEDARLQVALEAGRIEFQPQAMSLGVLLTEAAEACEQLFPDHIVQVYGLEGLPPVYADPPRVRQLLDRLLRNAARLSSSRGDTSRGRSLVSPLFGRVAIACRVKGGSVHIAVRNYGAPIPAEYKEAIFDRFPRLPGSHNGQPRSGLGLGLFVAREIARRLGGDLVLRRHAQGNTFTFSLPIAEAP